MSIIAVEGLNPKTSLFQVGKMLGKCIPGPFETLDYVNTDQTPFKTCYIQLSDTLDPVEVIEKINKAAHGKKKSILNAYVPDNVPNVPVTSKQRKKSEVPKGELSTAQIIVVAHNEIMMELQYKYTGLYNLSSKGSHSLLEAIGMTIYERLTKLASSEAPLSSSQLTSRYRKAHPHFGDFQLILGALHHLEDVAGAPRTQLQENELMQPPKDINVIDNVPYTKAQEAITKYTDKILKKLEEHVGSYELTENPEDSPEEAARKKVQTQLAKMMQYMPSIMQQVVANHFAEDCKKNRYLRMRIYGEPFLPSKDIMAPWLRRAGAQRAVRWRTVHNLLACDLPLDRYTRLQALDGVHLGGAKLIIRCSNAPIYRVSLSKEPPAELAEIDDQELEDVPME